MEYFIGMEPQKDNDLFFLCSLIEYIGRKTKNRDVTVVDALGQARLEKIYDLADVYHSDNIDRVSEDFIEECGLKQGDFDNIAQARYAVPSYWDLGKIYKRLILGIAREEKISVMEALPKAYHSFVNEKISDYNSSFYYNAPQNILLAYLDGYISW